MAQKRPHPDSASSSSAPSSGVFISDTIEDRSSTFIAHYSPDVAIATLKATPSLKTASHRITAWRKPAPQRTLHGNASRIFTTGSDDDGEKYAGRKLEKVLTELNVEGNIVVARWYGGVLLGPVRFTHIENVAREAIARARGINNIAVAEQPVKKPKLNDTNIIDEDAEKKRLAKQLVDRDRSVLALRGLLSEKQGLDDDKDVTNGQTTSSPAPTPDYTSMSLVKLKQLEKARDASIRWILKQIDDAESAAVQDDDLLSVLEADTASVTDQANGASSDKT